MSVIVIILEYQENFYYRLTTMKKYIFPLLIVLSSVLFAQSAGLNLSVGIPTGEFNNQVDRAAIGGNLEVFFLAPREHFPFSCGIDIGYYNYGYQSDADIFYDGPYSYDADVSRTNNIARCNIIFRVQPHEYSSITPYLDMFIGPAYLFTNTSITDRDNGDELASDVNKSSWIWNYGVGAGLLIQLNGSNPGTNTIFDNLYLDLKVRYNMSTQGEYLTESSIKVDPSNGDLYFTPAKTKVEFISISAGVHFIFSSFINPEDEDGNK
jgi:hypothetical protein